MRVRNPLALLILATMTSFCLFGMPLKYCSAEQNKIIFEKNTRYDVYYQLDDQIQYIANVKIVDTVKIGEVTFLEVVSSSLPTEQPGYISVTNIISILPAGSQKPQKI